MSGWLRIESAPGFLFVSEVTCVRVVGERVLVGGTIVFSMNLAIIGHTSLLAVEDAGGEDRVCRGCVCRVMARYSALLSPQMADFAGVASGQRVLVGWGALARSRGHW